MNYEFRGLALGEQDKRNISVNFCSAFELQNISSFEVTAHRNRAPAKHPNLPIHTFIFNHSPSDFFPGHIWDINFLHHSFLSRPRNHHNAL